jgi:arylsulfatase A-like enzyme
LPLKPLRIRSLHWLLSLVAFAIAPLRAAQPHLVLFLSDDHSMLDSSAYGSTEVRTPAMEELARDGLTFDRAFAASPTCAPSRAALLTGLMPARNGAQPNHSKPRADIRKLPSYLQALGYEVVAFGKVAHYRHAVDYGFDHFAHDGFHEDIAVEAALQWLRARRSDRPPCLDRHQLAARAVAGGGDRRFRGSSRCLSGVDTPRRALRANATWRRFD